MNERNPAEAARKLLAKIDEYNIRNLEDLRKYSKHQEFSGKPPRNMEVLKFFGLELNTDSGTYRFLFCNNETDYGITNNIQDIKEDLAELVKAA